MMKKTMAFLFGLTAAVMIAFFCIPVANAAVGDVFTDDFETETVGVKPAKWSIYNGTTGVPDTVTVVEDGVTAQKVLKIDMPASRSGSYGAQAVFSSAVPHAVISYRAKADNTNATAQIQIFGRNGSLIAQQTFINGLIRFLVSGPSYYTIQPFAAGQWYDFKIILNAVTHKIEAVFIDGEYKAGNLDIYPYANDIGGLRATMNNAAAGSVSLDDVNVYTYKDLQSLTLNKSVLSLTAGGSEKLVPVLDPIDASNSVFTWTSSNPAIASVDSSGHVTGIADGSAVITVSTLDESFSASCTVNVTYAHVQGIQLDPQVLNLESGFEGTLSVTFTPPDASNKSIVWTSSDPAVAAVAANGQVTALQEGEATITAVSVDGNFTDTASVIVTERSIQQVYYVSPDGDDENPGSKAFPFQTLQQARDAVRLINTSMTGDIIIYLRGGTYTLNETFQLNDEDSGTNGYSVHYMAYPDEKPVLSGGKQVTGWTLHDAGTNIYKAHLGQPLETRQLFVDGVRAVRARSTGGLTDVVKTATGYTTSDTFLAGWDNRSDLEFVYQKYWTNSRVGVDSISVSGNQASITMKQPAWFDATNKGGTSVTTPLYYENAFELLDTEGEWYLDRSGAIDGTPYTIYYKPRDWEDIETAEVIAPVMEELMVVQGSSLALPVHHIQFSGIHFQNTTWLRPSSNLGHADAQNNHIRLVQSNLAIQDILPIAAVTVERANHIQFVGNEFSKLGVTALKMVQGVQDSQVTGNKFYDLSGGAVNIGEPTINDPSIYKPLDSRLWMRNVDVTNNYIHDIAVEYQSAAAISAGFPMDMEISHNEIFNIPYSGIHVGYGWSNTRNSALKNVIIQHNFIHDFMGDGIIDGGGIYTLGGTGGTEQSPNLISENYIRNQKNMFAALYSDQGSDYWSYEDNVVDLSETPLWYHEEMGFRNARWANAVYVENISFDGNFSTTSEQTVHSTEAPVTNLHLYPNAQWPAEALAIIERSGLEAAYAHLAADALERIALPQNINITISQSSQLLPVATTGKGETTDLTHAEYHYFSEHPGIAQVDDEGTITGISQGNTKITAYVILGGVMKKLETNVYVEDQLNSIEFKDILEATKTILLDKSFQIEATGKTILGQDAPLSTITYSNNRPDILSVSSTGVVTPLTMGTAIITVTGTYNGETASSPLTVRVIKFNDEAGLLYAGAGINDVIADADGWYIDADGQNNKAAEAGSITISTPGTSPRGFAVYQGRTFKDELLTFNMQINAQSGWPSIMMRNQNPDEGYHMATNDTYVFTIGPDAIELHRFNGGVRTVIFGDLLGFKSIGGGPYPNDLFDYNTNHLVQVGAIDEAEGVRLILNVDGNNVFNFLDSYADRIASPGYMGLYARSGSIKLGEIEPTSIEIRPEQVEIDEGEQLQLTADPFVQTYQVNGFDITWSSDNAAIASVDASGELTAIMPGTTKVWAHIGDVSASVDVQVLDVMD